MEGFLSEGDVYCKNRANESTDLPKILQLHDPNNTAMLSLFSQPLTYTPASMPATRSARHACTAAPGAHSWGMVGPWVVDRGRTAAPGTCAHNT